MNLDNNFLNEENSVMASGRKANDCTCSVEGVAV